MIPVQMKAIGWYRTYGATRTSANRVYSYLISLNSPPIKPKRWCIDSSWLYGMRTSADNKDQFFHKGTPEYDTMMAKLKQDGIIE